jgi:hypothetical protein
MAITAPTKPDLIATSDSGRSNTDNVTNVTTPTFSGTATAGLTVTLYKGATVLGTGVADSAGVWTITSTTPLAHGQHYVYAKAKDTAGNESPASATLTITIDTSAPAAPTGLDLPAHWDSGVSNSDNITSYAFTYVTGNAESGSTVTLFDGETELESSTSSGTWGLFAQLPDGTYSLTAKATDLAGNVSVASAPLVVTVDAEAPYIPGWYQGRPASPDLLASSDSGSSDSDDITRVATPVFTGRTDPGATVALHIGNTSETVLGTAVADGAGMWTINSSHLADGVYRIWATVTDVAGNVAAYNGRYVTIDTTGPAAPSGLDMLASSDNGSADDDDITSITTPVITGTAEAGCTVTLFAGPTAVGTAVADQAGVWTITTTVLAAGVHSLTATAMDVAGNVSPPSAPLAITIEADTVAPSAPTELDLLAASDSGSSSSDDITNVITPVITGKAEAGSTVTLYAGETVLGTAVADAAGVWTITTSTLADGVHSLTASAVDIAGNVSAPSSPLVITVDTVAPPAPAELDMLALSDTGISDSDDVTRVTTPQITGNAEAGSSVTLYAGETVVGTAVADAAGVWTITTSALADGVHQLTATATDVAGNVSAPSLPLAITIDTTPPQPHHPPELAPGSDTGASGSDNITGTLTPTIVCHSEPGALVTLYDGDTVIGTAVADAAGEWAITTPVLALGVHHLSFTATDAAGNVSARSPGLAITVQPLPAAPSTPVLAPGSDTGISASDNVTSVTTPTVTGTAEPGTAITLYDGSTIVGTGTADSNGQWSITCSTLAEGSHHLTAVATNAEGYASAPSAALDCLIDTTPPAPPVSLGIAAGGDSGASSSDHLTKVTTPTWTGSAEPGSLVTLREGGIVLGSAVADSNGAWSITSAALADGVHALTLTATDVAGNVSAEQPLPPLTVDTAIATPAAPALATGSDNGPSSTDGITSVRTPSFTGSADAGSTVTLYSGTEVLGTAIVSGDNGGGSGTWSITVTAPMSLGPHQLTVVATDLAGNVSATSPATAIEIRALPAAPSTPDLATASDSGAYNTDDLTRITVPVFTGTAEAGVTVTLYEGATVRGSGVADANGVWSITANAAFTQGTHTLTAIATNAYGTSPSSSGLSFTIDTAAPALPPAPDLITAADSGESNTDNITNINRPTFSGTAEAWATVTLYDGSKVFATGTANGDGLWTITSPVAFSNAAHTITARITDLAGNMTTHTGPVVVTVDTARPAPSIPDMATTSDQGSSSTDNITPLTTPVFTGTAEAGTTVTLLAGTTVLGTTTAGSDGSWSITSTPLALGKHSVTVTNTDKAGNVGTSGALAVEIITTQVPLAPSAPDLAAGSDSGASSGDNLTNVTTPVFTGTAAPGTTVTLYEGGTVRGTGVANASGAWSITANSAFTPGSHTVTATATNGYGSSTHSGSFTFTVDTTAPTSLPAPDLVTASDSGVSNTDNYTNINRPTFSGTAEPGATVHLENGPNYLGNTVADAAGNWTITSILTFSDVPHGVTYYYTDLAGNRTSNSAQLLVSIDTTTPAPGLDLATTSDSGTSNTDNITAVTAPVFNGTAEAGASVTLYDGASALGTVTATTSGTWTFTSPALGLGTHQISAVSTDKAGNVGRSAVLPVEISRVPSAPGSLDLVAASDSGIANDDNRTNITTPTITGTADANTTITVYGNGVSLGTTVADAAGVWSFTSPVRAQGTHNFTARASNAIGLSAASVTLPIVVDTTTTAPANFDMTTASDTGFSTVDNVTSITTPVFTGLAEAGATVTLYEGYTVWGSTVANGSGSWSITSASMGDGAHSLTAVATDIAGNVSAPSVALLVTVDRTTPAKSSTPFIPNDTGSSQTDNITQSAAVSGYAEAGSKIAVYANGALFTTVTTNNYGTWTTNIGSLADGVYDVAATVTDAAGNTSAMSDAVSVTLDRTPAPRIAINLATASDTGYLNTDRYTRDTTPTLWGITDPGAKVKLTTHVDFDSDSSSDLSLGTAIADSNGYWELTTNALWSNETHEVRGSVTDVAGNLTESLSASLTFHIDTYAPRIWNYSIYYDSGAAGDYITNNTAVNLKVDLAVESRNSNTGTVVEVYEGTTLLGTSVSTAVWYHRELGDTTSQEILTTRTDLPALSEGSHHLTFKAIDGAGNVSVTTPLVLTIDTTVTATAPDLAASSDTGSSNTDNITRTTSPTFTGTSEPGAYIKLFEGDTNLGSTTADSAGNWTIRLGRTLSLGDHSFVAVVTDVANNTATSEALTVTIVATDTVGPVVLDLDGGGFDLLAASNDRATFDVNDDGLADHTGWIGAGDGLVVFDANGDGKANGISEIALSAYGPLGSSDLEGLAVGFDSNGDDLFDSQDAAWVQFGVWQDLNQNGASDAGEFQSFGQLGIVSISLSRTGEQQSVNGSVILGRTTFTWSDGRTGEAADVALSYVIDNASPADTNTEAVLVGVASA